VSRNGAKPKSKSKAKSNKTDASEKDPKVRDSQGTPVSVTFLGGLGEIGRNCACIELEGKILLLDCGLMFPDLDMLGIDLVLPDFTYLRENADRIIGCIATHGHEDHTGVERSRESRCVAKIMSGPLSTDQRSFPTKRDRKSVV
jgi:mRNA degradation ribonuclease J1/J2